MAEVVAVVIIDFNDPESIARWLRVWPERHTKLMRGLWRLWPDCRDAMAKAAKLLERS